MKIIRVDNANFSFGAKAYYDNEVKQVLQTTQRTETDFLREMFEAHRSNDKVLFSLTEDFKSKKKYLVATNLANGQTYPYRASVDVVGLNNLMGCMLNERTYQYDRFWNAPKKFNCSLEYLEEENGNSVLTIRKADSYCVPYKKRTVKPNGEVKIEHEYINGYKTVLRNKNGQFKLERISHRFLIPTLYDSCSDSDFNGVKLSKKTKDYYENLPTFLKRYCMESLEALLKSMKK